MSVFDNLIEELREENLIEGAAVPPAPVQADVKSKEPAAADVVKNPASDVVKTPAAAAVKEPPVKVAPPVPESSAPTPELSAPNKEAASSEAGEVILPFNENDFYRRRAMEEVSSLQMVERVFSGVEREQAKILPVPYDDIAVSKALHDFLQVSKNPDSPESALAEFKLMQETESWYTALAKRDQNLLPVHLRRYCETTRPVLSSQALVALARFYRNSPYSEPVRSKFDLIITRIFSTENFGDERQLVFEYDELVQHISELYADWSSVSLYSTDDDSELSIIALKFEDFITEATNAGEFETLIQSDFFNRLRAFKESTGENFYAPVVAAKAIKCNVRVGNRYIELLNEEKRKNNAAKLEDKYNYLLDQTISEATSKTLQLVQLLKERNLKVEEMPPPPPPPPVKVEEVKVQEPEKKVQPSGTSNFKQSIYGVNKWIVALTIMTILGTFGLYSWVELSNPQASSKEVQNLVLDGYYFKDYLKVAKVTNETLIGVAETTWFELSEEKKAEVLNNIIAVGKEKGFKSVHILSKDGKTVGYIAAQSAAQANSNSSGN